MAANPAAAQPGLRQTLGWLLLTQQMMVVHLIGILPDWALATANLALLWRLAIFLGKVPPPPPLLLFVLSLLVLLTLVPLYLQQGMAVGLSVMIALAYSLKSLEIRHRRDILMLILVGFFLISLSLIPQQSPLKLASALALVTLNITVLFSLHSCGSAGNNLGHTLRLALFSLPMALLLYLLVPRVDPLWHQGARPGAQTGLSDNLSLGQIAELTQSGELAFNVLFDHRPPQDQLYFRVWVHNLYDGRTWHGSYPSGAPPARDRVPGRGHRYQISHWRSTGRLPTLALSHGLSPGLRPLEDGLWRWQADGEQALLWAPGPVPASDTSVTRALQLPTGGNPKARALAESLAGMPTRQAVRQILLRFHQQPFHYTLSPPATGADEVDGFLFSSRAGFCGHYAGAMVFLLRAAGIPARVVTGYQGGRWQGESNRLLVRQLNAHAWVEFWVAGQGWLRTDPTAMVAPDRVDILGQQRLARLWGLSGWLKESVPIRSLGTLADDLNALWHRQVSGFDRQGQQLWFSQWVSALSARELMLLAAFTLTVALLLQLRLARMLRLPRLPAPELLVWRWLARRLDRLGVPAGANPSASTLVALAIGHCPQCRTSAESLLRLFHHIRYGGPPPRRRRRLKLAMWRQALRLRRNLAAAKASPRC